MTLHSFHLLLAVMTALAVVVFVSLHFVTAGYGQFRTRQWGPSIDNHWGWVFMEVPAFVTVAVIWALSPSPEHVPEALLAALFLLHYFQRSFVFPFLMNGRSRMPLVIMAMGAVFNVVNGIIQGGGLFWFPQPAYAEGWSYLLRWNVLLGLALFFAGMAINLHSDHVIRHLRRPGDTRHHLPQHGMYRYVTSANYLGELTEWTGFAIAAASPAAWVFVIWTAANLIPRANAIHRRYVQEFGVEAVGRRKRIFPFLY